MDKKLIINNADLVLKFTDHCGVVYSYYYFGDWTLELKDGELQWCWDMDSRDHFSENLEEFGDVKIDYLDSEFFEYNIKGYMTLCNFGYCLEGYLLKNGGLK